MSLCSIRYNYVDVDDHNHDHDGGDKDDDHAHDSGDDADHDDRVPKTSSARRQCRPEGFCASGKFLRVFTKLPIKLV